MIPRCLNLMEPMRREMQVAADRVRDRLRLVVVVETGQIAPARVAAQFDETSADHDAKAKPAKKPDHQNRRGSFRKWSRIKQRTKKDGQESRLEQLVFPTVAVPNLANVDDRHVDRPENREHDRVRVTGEDD
jgi:hypothetical protein